MTEEKTEEETEALTEAETELPVGSAAVISRIEDESEKVEDPKKAKTFANDPVLAGQPTNAAGTAKNAIQKAIDSILETLTDAVTSASIEVEEGDYRGDITIAASVLRRIADNFVLNIIAKNASRQTDSASRPVLSDNKVQTASDGTGGVNISGNILIEGVNVLMSGLTLAGGNKITVGGAHLDYYGTTAADNLTVELDRDASAEIVTGEGGDTLTVLAQGGAGNLNADTGAGDDTVTLAGTGLSYANEDTAQAFIRTGEGSDRVNIDAQAADAYAW